MAPRGLQDTAPSAGAAESQFVCVQFVPTSPEAVDYVFVAPNDWLTKKRQEIMTPKSETENG